MDEGLRMNDAGCGNILWLQKGGKDDYAGSDPEENEVEGDDERVGVKNLLAVGSLVICRSIISEELTLVVFISQEYGQNNDGSKEGNGGDDDSGDEHGKLSYEKR